MSLCILSSKGSDPEDFSNFVTEQIKFPKDAEVCLVSSHINRKMMVDKEVRLEAGGNTLGFQFGSGTLDALRPTTGYTPHSPSAWEIGPVDNHFPVIITDGEIPALANAFMNEPKYQPISPLVGGWISDVGVAPGDLFTFKNEMKIPDPASSRGNTRVEDILIQPGWNIIENGGVNNTDILPGTSSVAQPAGALYVDWVGCKGSVGQGSTNFVDKDPVWNTDTGQRLGVYTPLAGAGACIEGGGWTWGFNIDPAMAVKDIMGLRGGIFSNADFSGETAQNQSSNINKIIGGTDYSLWWEVVRADLASGRVSIDFCARNPKPSGSKGNQRDDKIIWGHIDSAPSTDAVRIGMRPVQYNVGGDDVYVIEGFFGRADQPTNAWTINPLPVTTGQNGWIKVTDPERPAPFAPVSLQFDLYRHLPLRMGCNTQEEAQDVVMNAVHHARTTHRNMSVASIATSPGFTFCLGDITPTDQATQLWDASVRQILRKSTIGGTLGFIAKYKRQTATLMSTTGAVADIGLDQALPIAKPLVVCLPDLPITGFYGNSAGELSAGTLNMNSGGTSGTILGVIPYGDKPLRDPLGAGAVIDPDQQRGEFFSAPMENWIQLSNPAPFSLSSIRCKITDALGQKPECLDPNTTITFKIRNKREYRDSFRQGGDASNFRNQ